MSDLAARYRELRERLGADHPDTRAAFDARRDEMLAEEADTPEGWWYLSFVDTTLPEPAPEDDVPGGPRWLGACFVRGHGLIGAVDEAWRLGINPGGQVASMGPMPVDQMPDRATPWLERLLTQADVDEMDRVMLAEDDDG